MLVRLVQSGFIVLVAGLVYLAMLPWAAPVPAAIVVGAVALVLVIIVAIRPLTSQDWEGVWESIAGLMSWW